MFRPATCILTFSMLLSFDIAVPHARRIQQHALSSLRPLHYKPFQLHGKDTNYLDTVSDQ